MQYSSKSAYPYPSPALRVDQINGVPTPRPRGTAANATARIVSGPVFLLAQTNILGEGYNLVSTSSRAYCQHSIAVWGLGATQTSRWPLTGLFSPHDSLLRGKRLVDHCGVEGPLLSVATCSPFALFSTPVCPTKEATGVILGVPVSQLNSRLSVLW